MSTSEPKVEISEINPSTPPSSTGCQECLATDGWWLHLRRCAACGHIGCCDQSPNQHATAHYKETGHSFLTSFEPHENWFYNYRDGNYYEGPTLAPPHEHPANQPIPGPSGKVPPNWTHLLH